jgi:Fur family ferric uptake transcriptional regulator
VILEELHKVKSHPTAVELYEIARRRLPRLSLATVYRNLERMAAEGVIRKLDLSGAENRFDADLGQHYHVRCVECGRVDDVHEPIAAGTDARHQQLSGYHIIGHRLEYMGICPACQGSNRETNVIETESD